MREIADLTDRERVMARLARKIAWGKDAIFHGTRHAMETLKSGKFLPPKWGWENAICFTRSPETASHFALMLGPQPDQWSGAILILDRRSLCCRFRLEPGRHIDYQDEREERIYGRTILLRRHLIGLVRDVDVSNFWGRPLTDMSHQTISNGQTRNRSHSWKNSGRQARDLLAMEETR